MTKARLLQTALAASVLTPGIASAQEAAPAAPAPAAVTTTGVAATTETKSEEGKEGEAEAWPVSGSVGMRYSFNHANFTPTESDSTAFGTQKAAITASASYPFLEKFSLDVEFNAGKELADSYYGANSSNTTVGQTDFGDSAVSVNANDIYKIPVLDIGISAGVGATIPTSKASQAADIYTSVGPSLSLSWSWERLNLGASASASYTWAEHPTQFIQRNKAAKNCEISGCDTGEPLSLWDISESFSVGVKIVDGLKFNTSYSVSHSMLSTKGKDDEFSAEGVQTGDQWSRPSHGTSFGLSYTVFEKTSVSASMGTRISMYDARGRFGTNPLFDTESNLHQRTNYSLGVSQAF